MTRWRVATDAVGAVIMNTVVLQATLTVATMPFWVWITLAVPDWIPRPPLQVVEQLGSPGTLLPTCVLIALFCVPALIAGSRTLSDLEDRGDTRIWRTFWRFYRDNYTSGVRVGAPVGLALLALGVVAVSRPQYWIALLVPLAVAALLTSHMVSFDAHLHLGVADNFGRSSYLLLHRPATTVVMIVTYGSAVTILALLPGAAVLLALTAGSFTSNRFFRHALGHDLPRVPGD